MFPVRNIIALAVTLAVLGAAQYFLSGMNSRWPGLILPGCSFALSLIWILNVAATEDLAAAILTMVFIFVLTNIPTLLLLAVYGAVRRRMGRRRELDRMNIEDLG